MSNYFQERKLKTNKQIRILLSDLPSFCTEFIVGIENSTSELTRLNYLYDLRVFFDYLQKEHNNFKFKSIKDIVVSDLNYVTVTDIEMFLSYLNAYYFYGKTLTNTERGKSRKLSTVRTLFKYFYNKDKISQNVTSKVSMPKLHDKNIVRLEIDEVSKLLSQTENPTYLSPMQQGFHEHTKLRDVAIITTLLGTGIRVSECVGLNISDVDFNINAFKIVRKGGNQVILYFPDEVETALRNYIAERVKIKCDDENLDALFISLQNKRISVRAVQNLVKKYALCVTPLKNISPHKLRSTFGTNLYNETEDIYVVAEILGHKNINTTKKHYAATNENLKREAIKKVKLK